MNVYETHTTECIKTGSEQCHSATFFIEILRSVLARGAKFRFQVKGSSMSPFIYDGDVLILSPLSTSSVRLGDIVVFVDPDNSVALIVHRIIKIRGDFFLVKGDNISRPDCFITRKNILGKVARIERNGKRVHFGLGTERLLIAIISDFNSKFPLGNRAWHLFNIFIKK